MLIFKNQNKIFLDDQELSLHHLERVSSFFTKLIS